MDSCDILNHTYQGYFIGTGAMVQLYLFQDSNTKDYEYQC